MADPIQRVHVALDHHTRVCARAPGRINVIGEHTDYIGGLALPAAIDRHIVVGLRARSGHTVIHSVDVPGTTTVDWSTPITRLPPGTADWVRYMVGAIAEFVAHVGGPNTAPQVVCAPFEGAVAGSVPRGAGLSSSAALCVAWMNALAAWSGHPLNDRTIVHLARRVEHRWLGVACGALDQTASQMGRVGRLLWVDFRSMAVDPVLAGGLGWIVLDTGVRRGLAHSAYTERVRAVTDGLASIRERHAGVTHWRDLALHHLEGLDGPRWLRHGITENARVEAMVEALGTDDVRAVGRLLNESHASLRDDYAVSCGELDAMARCARQEDGVYGARMVGAGFGGCVLAAAEAGAGKGVLEGVLGRYRAATGRAGAGWVVRPGSGAGLV